MADEMVTVRVHIIIPTTEIAYNKGQTTLERVKLYLSYADAINPDILEQMGGVKWSLVDQEEAPAGDEQTALALAQEKLQGETAALVGVLLALQEDHPEDCACRAHIIINTVRTVDEMGDDFDAVETTVEEAIERIL